MNEASAEGQAAKKERRGRFVRLEVGQVFSTTVSLWLRNFVPITLIALLIGLPFFFLVWYLLIDGPIAAANWKTAVAGALLETIPSVLTTGVITYGVISDLRGRKVGIADSLRQGFARFGPVLATGLLAGVIIAVGYLLLIVPGIILSAMFMAAVPVAVVEGKLGPAALRRSAELTRDNRATLFLAAMIIGLLAMAIGALIGMGIGATGVLPVADGSLLAGLWPEVLSLVFGGLQAVLGAVVYHELRTRREGASIDDLLAVFD